MPVNYNVDDFFPGQTWGCHCGCGLKIVSEELKRRLIEARIYAGAPFTITSVYRCPTRNAAVGGKPDSAHLAGLAADIACEDSPHRFKLIQALLIAGFRRIEVAPRHIHVDVDQTKAQDVIWLLTSY